MSARNARWPGANGHDLARVISRHDTARPIVTRRFRHLFRNSYKTQLVPAKIRFANEAAEGLRETFRTYHDRFDRFLWEFKRELAD